jgi:hypothetical protein
MWSDPSSDDCQILRNGIFILIFVSGSVIYSDDSQQFGEKISDVRYNTLSNGKK